jgi:heme/copper-type cytochrome/quinol oxidase subunit 3
MLFEINRRLMFIIETNSKPLRKWSKLMFVLFLITHIGMFGGLLTMHMYVKPKEKK